MKNLTNTTKHRLTARLAVIALFGALLSAVPFHAAFAQTAPALGAALEFAVLGGTNVTCTDGSVVTGDVGVSPGSAVPFTVTGCTIAGGTPPATNTAADQARIDFLNAYAALQLELASCIQMPGNLANQNLAPGIYCLDAVAKAGLLTLTGGPNDVWIFFVNGALTGTNFSVAMAGGGQPCNVFWAPLGALGAATMTDSAFKGNILAGDATGGSITLTRGTLAGRALANIAVTITGTSVIGCGSLVSPPIDKDQCKDYCKDNCKGHDHHNDHDNDNDNDNDDDDDDDHDDDHDKDKDKDKRKDRR